MPNVNAPRYLSPERFRFINQAKQKIRNSAGKLSGSQTAYLTFPKASPSHVPTPNHNPPQNPNPSPPPQANKNRPPPPPPPPPADSTTNPKTEPQTPPPPHPSHPTTPRDPTPTPPNQDQTNQINPITPIKPRPALLPSPRRIHRLRKLSPASPSGKPSTDSGWWRGRPQKVEPRARKPSRRARCSSRPNSRAHSLAPGTRAFKTRQKEGFAFPRGSPPWGPSFPSRAKSTAGIFKAGPKA